MVVVVVVAVASHADAIVREYGKNENNKKN